MYFDFYDRYESVEAVGSAISRREGVVLSVVVHAAVMLLLLLAPQLECSRPRRSSPRPRGAAPARPGRRAAIRRRRAAARRAGARRRRRGRGVRHGPHGQRPRLGRAAREPAAVRARRLDRAGRSRARGTADGPWPRARAGPAGHAARRGSARRCPTRPRRRRRRATPPLTKPQGGALGEALRDLQKYVQRESFNNPQGGVNEFGPAIQFDTKGVEFGPWIRRFVAQVKRNWFVPNAAYAMRGRVDPAVQRPQGRLDHRHQHRPAVGGRLVQPLGLQRHRSPRIPPSRCRRTTRRTRRSSR